MLVKKAELNKIYKECPWKQKKHIKKTDQTEQLYRLICVFAAHVKIY